jgi:proline iminopeptidase
MRIARGLIAASLLLGAAAAPPPATLAPGEHHAVVDGVRLWYRVAGRPAGVPVIFLHGGPGQGSQSFMKLAGPALERKLRMVYLDQRGAGRSERPWTGAYSMDLLAQDIEALREAWGVPKVALIGHSFGTALALHYAAKYPAHTDRIVLSAGVMDIPAATAAGCDRLASVDPAAHRRALAAVAPGSDEKCNIFKAFEKSDGFQAFIRGNMFPDPAISTLVKAADEEGGLRNTGELQRALFNQGLLRFRFAAPERLTMPVLVIAGEKDFQAVSGLQRAFAARLLRGRFIEYAGAGHFMWAEQPERFAADVQAFLGGGRK